MELPSVPEDVDMIVGEMINAQQLRLQTFVFKKKQAGSVRGVIFLCHSYASHTQFEWFRASAPGDFHEHFEDSFVEAYLNNGFICITLDHQGHGRSEGARGKRCYFNRFDDLAQEATDFVDHFKESYREYADLPFFLAGLSMGGCTAVRMAQMRPTFYKGMILFAPMLSLDGVSEETLCLCLRNRHLKSISSFLSNRFPTMPVVKVA